MMSVILVLLLVRDFFQERPWTMFAVGSIAGLEAITKVEFALAAYLLIGVAIFLRALRSRSISRLIEDVAFCIPGLLLCVGVYGWYIRQSSFDFIFAQNMPILPDSYFAKSVGELRAKWVGSTISPSEIAKYAVAGLLGVAAVAGAVRLACLSRGARWLVGAAAVSVCALHLATLYAC